MAQHDRLKSAAVMASVSDYGVANKDARGIVADTGAVPDTLKQVQGVLSRFAQRMGVDLSGPLQDIAANAKQKLATPKPTPTRPAPQLDNGFTL